MKEPDPGKCCRIVQFDCNFMALEPMAGITDAMNLAHKELYKELQTIPRAKSWQESFWIRPSGFR
jgi:aldose 1-epimerase